MKNSRHAVLSETATFDKETAALRIVIETPKGSRNKYKYVADCDCLELATVLPEGMVFPYDFGFIPSTIGEDGDPLDVLVLMDAPVVPGCVIRGRLIGALKAQQREKRESRWVRNDRLIAVATHAQTHENEESINDLREHLADEIEAFFVDYNKIRGREFECLARCGPRKAMKIVTNGQEVFKARHRKTEDRKTRKNRKAANGQSAPQYESRH